MLDQIKTFKTLDFSDVIAPYTLEDFGQDYWEKQDLCIKRGDKAYFSDLFTIEEVDDVFRRHNPTGPDIRVVKNQEPMPASAYENANGALNLNQLYAAYADGYTLVINAIERFVKSIEVLVTNVSRRLNHRCVANMYLTPKGQKALMPHYDTHDVYVLQIHGKKHWRLYDADYETPLLGSHQPILDRDQLKNCRYITVEAGDVMYIPRGVPHDAFTSNESSIHLTLGIYPPQWLDLITASLKAYAQSEVSLRRSLPIGYLDRQEEFGVIAKETCAKLMDELATQIDLSKGLQQLEEAHRQDFSPRGDGHFAHLDQLDEINVDTRLIKRQNLKTKVIEEQDVSRILFPGNAVRGPKGLSDTLAFVSSQKGPFAVRDIPHLSDRNKIALAQRLVRGGLLKLSMESLE